MSRIGKLPITIPTDVKIVEEGKTLTATGPKGSLSVTLLPSVKVGIEDTTIKITRENNHPDVRAIHGLMRQLISNMVTGVSTGFEKKLELKGVGYRAAAEGDKKLTLSVGYSHPVTFEAPENVTFKVEKNVIVISGIDKQVVGEIAARIRQVRLPEPYKGKGIMYQGEHIRRKAGKAAKAASA